MPKDRLRVNETVGNDGEVCPAWARSAASSAFRELSWAKRVELDVATVLDGAMDGEELAETLDEVAGSGDPICQPGGA